jgi:FkbM family methyltransferase
MSVTAYLKNRAKSALRPIVPAGYRLRRSGESFLAGGEREVKLLPTLVKPGTIALDVGANIGDYSYAIAKLIGTGHIYAFEPLPTSADFLRRAVRALHLPVTVLNIALSDSDGHADLLVPQGDGTLRQGFASLERTTVQAGQTFRVPKQRLDAISEQFPGPISFIKIDVEGHEPAVLRGAAETIKRHRPNLLIEIEARHSPVPLSQTIQQVLDLGYQCQFLDENRKLAPIEQFDQPRHQPDTGNPANTADSFYVSNFIFTPKQ